MDSKQQDNPISNVIQTDHSKIYTPPFQLNYQLFSRFVNFMSNQKFKKLKVAMQNYIGRNTPIKYHSQYKFQEQWQNKKKFNSKSISNFLRSHNIYAELLALTILIGYCLIVWLSSFELVFQQNNKIQINYLHGFGLCIVFLHISLKLVIYMKMPPHDCTGLDYAKNFALDIIFILYFIVKLILTTNIEDVYNDWTIAFDLFFIINAFLRGAQIYKSFKMKVITSRYKDIFNLFDLLATLLILAHLFVINSLIKALTLYLVGSSGFSDVNWIKLAKIQDQDPKTLYIYSIYFACTTMLTVGYGDLTPKNVLQIITVLTIQIFGIAIFAYVINQIGHTLSSMRQQQQNLQKDLSSLSKVAKYYGLDYQLQAKAKTYIIDNQRQIGQLLPQEQKQLLLKLNDQLRTEINQQNSLKIIKQSLFFICHWSKKLQYQIAKKLNKKLYSPNQKLLQNPGRQCLYLIKNGKVDIYTDRYSGLKRHFKRLLKTIAISNQQVVSHNVYGYTAAVSRRPIRLSALTKDFTIVYLCQKNDFIESIMENQIDFQYYHQIKCKIDMEKLPEAFEAPSILSVRQHYRPNVFFVIKKNQKKFQKSIRSQFIRDQAREQKRRMKVRIYQCFQQLKGEFDQSTHNLQQLTTEILKPKTMTKVKITYLKEEFQIKQNLHFFFDSMKEYENYFKKFNYTNILSRERNQNYMLKTSKAKIESLRRVKSFDPIKNK